MASKLNFSTQLSDKQKLAQIAKSLGYVQTRGQKGEGSIRALLEAIIEGEVVVQPRRSAPRNKVTKTLEQMEAEGLITRPKPVGALSKFEPIRIEGEPLSETILRERHRLRTGDAVQLAGTLTVKQRLPSLVFVSADDELNRAATVEGLTVENLNWHS